MRSVTIAGRSLNLVPHFRVKIWRGLFMFKSPSGQERGYFAVLLNLVPRLGQAGSRNSDDYLCGCLLLSARSATKYYLVRFLSIATSTLRQVPRVKNEVILLAC